MMPKFADNLPRIPGGLLDRARADWKARGWDIGNMGAFRMEGEGGDGSAGAGTGAGQGGAAGSGAGQQQSPPGISQEEMQRIAAREKDEGARKALKDAADALGMSIEDAKKLIDAHREAEKGKMSEAERLAAEAADQAKKAQERESAAEAREKAAAARQRTLDITDALIDADVRKDRRTAALRLIDVPDDADDKAIAAAVEKCKTDYPEFFGASTPPPPGGDPTRRPPAATGAQGGVEASRQKYAQERQNRAEAPDPFAGMTVLGRQ